MNAKKSVKITIMDYDREHLREWAPKTVEECIPLKNTKTVSWINIEGIDKDSAEKMVNGFGLHPLVLKSIMNPKQHPKLENFGDYLHIVLRMIYDRGGRIVTEQVNFIVAKHFILTFQEGVGGDVFDPVRERIRGKMKKTMKGGTDYLVYMLIDSIVESYFDVLQSMGDRIAVLEDRLIAAATPKTLEALHNLKMEMLYLRKSVWPLREVVGKLERGESGLISMATAFYFRDVYEHIVQAIDTVETFRDMLTGMVDIYLSSVSNRLNEIMKVLTIISTIFIPLTFIVGLYGMNFKYMPELSAAWGYPMVWAIMLIVSATMLLYFRKKKWM